MKSRLIQASVLAIAGAIVLAGSSLACYKPPKPPEKVLAPEASVLICGDPRVQSTLDNSGSNVTVHYQLKFRNGKNAQPVIVNRYVKAGQTYVTRFLWAHGSAPFIVKAKTAEGWQVLVKESVRGATPWNKGACPANRFG